MKRYLLILCFALAGCAALATDEDECFTDACVGCLEDCLDSKE